MKSLSSFWPCILVIAFVALAVNGHAQAESPAANNGIALVIGNAEYVVGALANASQDAKDVASALTDLGFDVRLKQDVDFTDLVAAIDEFGAAAKKSPKTALFYFSGHGLQVNGEDYLIPIDATSSSVTDIGKHTVRLQRVFDALGARSAPNVIILDACRVNPFISGTGGSWVKGLAIPGNSPPNSLIAFSTAPGTVASDGEGTHSPYTRALLRYIRAPGQDTSELFNQVRNDVKANTDNIQVSWESTSLRGAVIFRDPAYLYGQFLSADDDALILLNGQDVLDWNRDGSTKKRLQLQGGLNDVRIMVYNQRSYTGGVPLIGGHLPEGWNYSLALTRTDGSPLVTGLSALEDRPEDNGPHHGKLFTVATMKIVVDETSNGITVQSLDPNAWTHQ